MEDKINTSKWLDNLQQESWQLEMIFSGLSIALLNNAMEPIITLAHESYNWGELSSFGNAIHIFLNMAHMSFYLLLINLCIHLFLRGLWISAVGLRYVSKDIDYEKLNYSPPFTNYLAKRIGNFDGYIGQIERLCSIIFSFSFLLVFSLFSFIFFLIVSFFAFDFIQNYLPELVFGTLFSIYVFFSVLYFIDFITFGFFKRQKKYFNWYLYIYRFFSVLTLAFLYRPIYYNLIDNRYGKRFALLVIPYLVFVFLTFNMRIHNHKYYPSIREGNEMISEYDYLDSRPADNTTTFWYPKIASKFVSNGFLEIFIPYNPGDEDATIKAICPDFDNGKYVGFSTGINISINNYQLLGGRDKESQSDSTMICLKQLFRVYLNDSLIQDVPYQFKAHQISDTKGLTAIFDIQGEKRGKHALRVDKQELESNSLSATTWSTVRTISFWKE